MGVNVQVIGRLGSDAEIKNGNNGQFITFRMATDEYRNGKNETAWLNVMDGSPRGLKIAQYLKKGSMVNVIGSETVGIYQSKSGEYMASRDIRALTVDFVNSGQSGSTQSNDSTTSTAPSNGQDLTCGTLTKPKQTVKAPTSQAAQDPSDDLPF